MGRHSTVNDESGPSARSDLELLRADPRLRAQALAAALVPTAAYSALLVALGAMWLWADLLIVPVTTGGVAVGALLERAHRRSG